MLEVSLHQPRWALSYVMTEFCQISPGLGRDQACNWVFGRAKIWTIFEGRKHETEGIESGFWNCLQSEMQHVMQFVIPNMTRAFQFGFEKEIILIKEDRGLKSLLWSGMWTLER